MMTAMKTIDTLKVYERFKKAKTSDAQARELAEILRELTDDQLASKNDLIKTEAALTADLKKTEAALTADLKKTEAALTANLKETEARLQTEIKTMELGLKETESRLQVEIQKSKTEILKWIIGWVTGLIVAQTGFLMGFLKLAF